MTTTTYKYKTMRGFEPGCRSGDLFRRKQAEIDAAREMNLLRRLDSSERKWKDWPMHTTSAAVAKGKYPEPHNLKPREGTKVRAAFDLFCANKGKVVDWCTTKNSCVIITQLQDTYGLDIRRIKKSKYCLVGEWFGNTYIDYVAMRR